MRIGFIQTATTLLPDEVEKTKYRPPWTVSQVGRDQRRTLFLGVWLLLWGHEGLTVHHGKSQSRNRAGNGSPTTGKTFQTHQS